MVGINQQEKNCLLFILSSTTNILDFQSFLAIIISGLLEKLSFKAMMNNLIESYRKTASKMQDPIKLLEEEIIWYRRYDKYTYSCDANKERIKAMQQVVKELKNEYRNK